MIILQIVSRVVILLLDGVLLAMFLRAIMSWFPIEPNKFTNFLYAITEPFIFPIRSFFRKMPWFQNIPIDISFTVAYLLILLVITLLTL